MHSFSSFLCAFFGARFWFEGGFFAKNLASGRKKHFSGVHCIFFGFGFGRIHLCLCRCQNEFAVQKILFGRSDYPSDNAAVCRGTCLYPLGGSTGLYHAPPFAPECFAVRLLGAFDSASPLFFPDGVPYLPSESSIDKSESGAGGKKSWKQQPENLFYDNATIEFSRYSRLVLVHRG